jgi:4'-phosphopantetheinyl transferase EntD
MLLFPSWAVFAQKKGQVIINQDPKIDSLIAKRIALYTEKPSITNPSGTTILGYRVQIFYGLERKEAFAQEAKFKALFPEISSYISYTEPNYRLKVGDFRTRLEAQKFMTELRSNFPTLFIFREKINPQN